MINLNIIDDLNMRENFKSTQNDLNRQVILSGDWKFLTFSTDKAVTDKEIAHGMDTIPADIIQTSITGPGTVTYNYAKFDKDLIYVTATDACSIRFLCGKLNANAGGKF